MTVFPETIFLNSSLYEFCFALKKLNLKILWGLSISWRHGSLGAKYDTVMNICLNSFNIPYIYIYIEKKYIEIIN